MDPDATAGATSLLARYHAQLGTRNYSTSEQLDGESFRLSKRHSGSSDPTTCSSLTRSPPDHVDSDAEVDILVQKASFQHRGATSESIGTCSSQSCHQNNQTTIQTPVRSQTRRRSKTTSSIPQNSSSFAKLAQDKLLRMELDPSFAIVASSSTPGSHEDISNLTPSPSISTSSQPLHHPSISQPSSSSTPEGPVIGQASETVGRVQSAPARREQSTDQGIRPNAGRSQSDPAVRSSPTKPKSGRPSDVRKRIEELEARMRGGAK